MLAQESLESTADAMVHRIALAFVVLLSRTLALSYGGTYVGTYVPIRTMEK